MIHRFLNACIWLVQLAHSFCEAALVGSDWARIWQPPLQVGPQAIAAGAFRCRRNPNAKEFGDEPASEQDLF